MLPGGSPSPTGLAGVIQAILGKGPVIDVCIRVFWRLSGAPGTAGPAERAMGSGVCPVSAGAGRAGRDLGRIIRLSGGSGDGVAE